MKSYPFYLTIFLALSSLSTALGADDCGMRVTARMPFEMASGLAKRYFEGRYFYQIRPEGPQEVEVDTIDLSAMKQVKQLRIWTEAIPLGWRRNPKKPQGWASSVARYDGKYYVLIRETKNLTTVDPESGRIEHEKGIKLPFEPEWFTVKDGVATYAYRSKRYRHTLAPGAEPVFVEKEVRGVSSIPISDHETLKIGRFADGSSISYKAWVINDSTRQTSTLGLGDRYEFSSRQGDWIWLANAASFLKWNYRTGDHQKIIWPDRLGSLQAKGNEFLLFSSLDTATLFNGESGQVVCSQIIEDEEDENPFEHAIPLHEHGGTLYIYDEREVIALTSPYSSAPR